MPDLQPFFIILLQQGDPETRQIRTETAQGDRTDPHGAQQIVNQFLIGSGLSDLLSKILVYFLLHRQRLEVCDSLFVQQNCQIEGAPGQIDMHPRYGIEDLCRLGRPLTEDFIPVLQMLPVAFIPVDPGDGELGQCGGTDLKAFGIDQGLDKLIEVFIPVPV